MFLNTVMSDRWILSLDDDVILPPFALMSMSLVTGLGMASSSTSKQFCTSAASGQRGRMKIGRKADEANCFTSLPLTQILGQLFCMVGPTNSWKI